MQCWSQMLSWKEQADVCKVTETLVGYIVEKNTVICIKFLHSFDAVWYRCSHFTEIKPPKIKPSELFFCGDWIVDMSEEIKNIYYTPSNLGSEEVKKNDKKMVFSKKQGFSRQRTCLHATQNWTGEGIRFFVLYWYAVPGWSSRYDCIPQGKRQQSFSVDIHRYV